jgi:hypothetical protein
MLTIEADISSFFFFFFFFFFFCVPWGLPHTSRLVLRIKDVVLVRSSLLPQSSAKVTPFGQYRVQAVF